VERWGLGKGCLLPSQQRGLGKRRKLTQRGRTRGPSRKRVLLHFEVDKRIWCVAIWYFCDILNLANAQRTAIVTTRTDSTPYQTVPAQSKPSWRLAGKPPRSSHLGLPSHRGINQVPSCLAGVKAGRVRLSRMAGTLCDPIRHVTLRSSEIGLHMPTPA